MFERILPVIVALIALQIFIRFMQRRRSKSRISSPSRYSEYKEKIDRLMKVNSLNDGVDDRVISDEIHSGIANPELVMKIPDSMREVRRGLNLIIDGLNHAVDAKIGAEPADIVKYKDAAQMFDELVEVIKKHQLS